MVTGGHRITWRKTCPSANLSTTNTTLASRGSNSVARGERPAITALSMAQPMKNETNLNSTEKFSCDPTNGRSHGTCSTQSNRVAPINTPSTWGTPWTNGRLLLTQQAVPVPEEPRLDQMTARSVPCCTPPPGAKWRVAYLLTNRLQRVSHKYSVAKLAQNVLQL